MKKYILALMLLMVIISLVACSSKEGKNAEKASKDHYVIAMDINMAPFEFKENDEWVGIDVDLLAAIADMEGFTYETKHMNFNGIIPAVQAGQVDGALAAMFIKEERKETLDFSKGYFESGIGAFTTEVNTEINDETNFKDKIVAVKKGESGAAYAEKNKDEFNLEIRYFDDATAVFQEVANGGANFGLLDYPIVAYRLTVDKESGLRMINILEKMDYGFAVKKGKNAELLEKFNSGLEKLMENGKYDEIISKYISIN
ncbi:transporter substrate-binding domain-containing protein [Psychrobacillus lasiicapitis]|uniref:Transporter substrate-binding domain-containing protein n=1 Tax=Psychrobacillus lasiicapitis TaxID=1636719 RepID=A0A544TGS8_9BACI|nr:transporter substrate-binding domain-containing protein [Psychrobacillus lasiicapitis]TQR16626.1 transporter substrate-binding domain-containing protein [Psychrobacillus lasiicapitis]GGA28567.1 hypothetical protein GCM10011384_17500 [Psychrobacillus lasiicapitis]